MQNTEKLTTQAGVALTSPEAMSKLAGWTHQASDPEVAYHIAETVHKALSVAELIIKEEKYRGIATVDAPQVTKRLLSLLENVKTPEAKKMALRMIGLMAQSMESRLEFCRLDGYRKVLRVLHESPDHLSKEAINTLSHLIEAHDSEAAAAAADAPPRLKEVMETAATRTQAFGLKFALNPSSVWETTKAAVAEAQKRVGKPNAEEDTGEDNEDESGGGDGGDEFPPSRCSIARRMEEVEVEVKELYEMEPSPLERNLTPRAFADYLASEHMQGEGLDDELMKEIMGVQGALSTLTSKLAEAARDVKLDLMATISKLLRNSKRNQREFKNIDGYGFLREMFDSISDYQSPASQAFLKDVFGILQGIIVDATPEKAVKNLDALELVLRLVCSECHIEVRRRAVLCVHELLFLNALNVVCIRHVKGFESLQHGAAQLRMPRGMQGAVLQGRPEYRLMEEICEVLTYSAVLLSRHNSDLVEDILKLGMSEQRMHDTVRMHLLNCARDLLRDRNSRKLPPVSAELKEIVIKSMRQVLSKSGTACSPVDLQEAHRTPADAAQSGTPAHNDVALEIDEAGGGGAGSRPLAHAGGCGAAGVGGHGVGGSADDVLSSSSTSPSGRGGAWTVRAEEEEEDTWSNFQRFMRVSMAQKRSKEKAAFVILEAVAHAVSLDILHRAALRSQEKPSSRSLDNFTKTFSVDNPLQFETQHGFDMLVEVILSDACESASSLSLWMIFELTMVALESHACDLSSHIVRVLDIPVSRMSVKKRLMCLAMLRSWLQDLNDTGDKGQQVGQQLRDAGCMASLVSLIEFGGPAIGREALLALASLASTSEKLKCSMEARVGLSKLSRVVAESALAQCKSAFDLVVVEACFHMASLGAVRHGIVSLNLSTPPRLAPWVLQCHAGTILNVRRPAALYAAKMTRAHVQESSGVMSTAETYAKSDTASRRSEGSSRTSRTGGGAHRRDASVSSRASDRRPKSGSSVSSEGHMDMDDLDVHLEEAAPPSPRAHELGAGRDAFVVRSPDAALMLVRVCVCVCVCVVMSRSLPLARSLSLALSLALSLPPSARCALDMRHARTTLHP